MPEEYLDIVDINNNLTGKKELRSKIHSEGIWHRTVHIYLFTKDNNDLKFIVHLRSPFKDLCPNLWDTRFGGHLKSGTTVEEGLINEIKEEIGLEINKENLYEGKWYKRNKFPNCEFTKIYFLEYNEDIKKLKFNDGEVQEAKWMKQEEIKKSLTQNPEFWSPGIKGFTKITNDLNKLLNK